MYNSDEPLRAPAQEFDFDTDSEGDTNLSKTKQRSRLLDRSLKNLLTGTESGFSDSEDSGSEDGRKRTKGKTTLANMEARSRAMDAEAAKEAEIDIQELQDAVAAGEMDDEDLDGVDGDEDDGEEGGSSEPIKVLTSEEREAEKKAGGPDIFTVQRRLRHCARVLQNFKTLGKGRYVVALCTLVLVIECISSTFRPRVDYVSQLMSDIAGYYGYNEFLAEKLFNMFPVGEVSPFTSTPYGILTSSCRQSSFLRQMKFLGP